MRVDAAVARTSRYRPPMPTHEQCTTLKAGWSISAIVRGLGLNEPGAICDCLGNLDAK